LNAQGLYFFKQIIYVHCTVLSLIMRHVYIRCDVMAERCHIRFTFVFVTVTSGLVENYFTQSVIVTIAQFTVL